MLQLEAKEFGDQVYFSYSDTGGNSLKQTLDQGNFHRRRIHFLHSIIHHRQMETIMSMLIRDHQLDNYKLFLGQEDIKCILRDIRYNLDDIVIRLSSIESFIVSNSNIESKENLEGPSVINAPAQASPQANSTNLSPIIILD